MNVSKLILLLPVLYPTILFAMMLQNERLAVEICDKTGKIYSITDRKDNRRIIKSSYDIYELQPSPQIVKKASENDDVVTRINNDEIHCVNPKLPGIDIVKKYTLDGKILSKKVIFSTKQKNLGFLRQSSRTVFDNKFFTDGYLNNPSRHVFGTQMPYINTKELKNVRRMLDFGPEADFHLFIYTNPGENRGVAQYRFKVDGHFIPPLTNYSYQSGMFFYPDGWQMGIASKWLSSDREAFSTEMRWHLFDGDQLKFHEEYLNIPEFVAMWNRPVPEWMKKVNACLMYETHTVSYEKFAKDLQDYLNRCDDGYILVTLRGLFTATRDISEDVLVAPGNIRIPQDKIKSIVDRLHAISPRVKVAPLIWLWSYPQFDPVATAHPEWNIYNPDGTKHYYALDWEMLDKTYLPLMTKELREYMTDQFKRLIKKYNFDLIYADSGQGGITAYDWRTKRNAQDYDWMLLYKGIQDAARSVGGGTYFNGMTNIFSSYSDFGIYEGMSIHREHWQAISDRLLIGKLFTKHEGQRIVPLYWESPHGKKLPEAYPKYCYTFALTPIDIFDSGYYFSSSRWPIAEALEEIGSAKLLPDADVKPCWWKDNGDVEAYLYGFGKSALMTVWNHGVQKSNIVVQCNLQAAGFNPALPVHVWRFDPRTVSELESVVGLYQTQVNELFRKDGISPFRAVKAAYLQTVSYPTDGRFRMELPFNADQCSLLLLTQEKSLCYAKDGRPCHFLLPPDIVHTSQVKTIPSDKPMSNDICKSRDDIRCDKVLPAKRPDITASSPQTVNRSEQAVNRTVNGIGVLRTICISCNHNEDNSSSVDIDKLQLNADMGNHKIWGFSSSTIETSNLGKIRLAVSISRALPAFADRYAFAGIVIDYHSTKGYVKRVLFPVFQDNKTGDRPWTGYAENSGEKEPVVINNLLENLTPGHEKIFNLNLTEFAPTDWDGKTQISAVVDKCCLNFKISVRILGNVSLKTGVIKIARPDVCVKKLKPSDTKSTEWQGGAYIYAFKGGASLKNGVIIIPSGGMIEASGILNARVEVKFPASCNIVKLQVKYLTDAAGPHTYSYTFEKDSSADFLAQSLDLRENAPPDWTGRCVIEVQDKDAEVRITFNSSFKVF